MSEAVWDVVAAEVSQLEVARSVVTAGGTDQRISVPIIMWILRNGSSTVIVDTGTHAPGTKAAAAHSHPLIQRPGLSPIEVLGRLGVDPMGVTHVVNTHLHWDHCSNNDLFENAAVYIQARDIIASLDPPVGQELSCESARVGMTPPWLKAFDRTVPVWGDFSLLPGVTLLALPGHTPGSQGVLVSTDGGEVLLAGDTVPINCNVHSDAIARPGLIGSPDEIDQTLLRVQELGVPVLAAHDRPARSTELFEGIWQVRLGQDNSEVGNS